MQRMPTYLIPKPGLHRTEEIIKRSRFIVSMKRCSSVEEARAFIDEVKQEFTDATHNCSAFNAGPAGDTAWVGLSDDGEPSGTAGKPMLTQLIHSGVGEIAAVVTRYFGGTKLGTGGLVKAYGGMVALGLEKLPTETYVETAVVQVIIDYSDVTLFKRMLSEYNAEMKKEGFADRVAVIVELPADQAEDFSAAVVEMTNGRGKILPF